MQQAAPHRHSRGLLRVLCVAEWRVVLNFQLILPNEEPIKGCLWLAPDQS